MQRKSKSSFKILYMFAQMFQRIKGISKFGLPNISHEKQDWSDALFLEKYKDMDFPASSESTDIDCIKTWFKFCYGRQAIDFPLSDVMECVLGIFFTRIEAEADSIAGVTDQQKRDNPNIQFLLKELDNENNKETALRSLILIAGYMALILVRLMVKKPVNVSLYIKDKMSLDLDKFFPDQVRLSGNIPPPKMWFLNLIHLKMENKNCTDRTSIFVPILKRYIKFSQEGNNQLVDILNEGCLQDMKANGLQTISLLLRASKILGRSTSEVLSYVLTESNKENVTRLVEFLMKYGNIGVTDRSKKEYSWWWSRVVDDSYFIRLAAKYNVTLCVYLAGIIANVDPNVFQIVCLQRCVEFRKEHAIAHGQKVFKVFSTQEKIPSAITSSPEWYMCEDQFDTGLAALLES